MIPNSSLPKISIIVAVYNCEAHIATCLTSLLNQDYPREKLEIIIADNGSTDKTKDLILQFPVTYVLENTVQSSYAARNTGARQATGEGLAFFDADQEADPSWLRQLINGWQDPQYGAFAGKYIPMGQDTNLAGKYWHQQEASQFRTEFADHEIPKLGGGNTLIRRSVFEELGGFDSQMISWGDFDFSYRLKKKGYRVKYNAAALVKHFERTTVKKLLKREYRIGFGKSSFLAKHPEQKESICKDGWVAIKRTALGVLALVYGLIKPLPGKNRKEHLAMILFDIAMRWMYVLGRMQHILGFQQRKQPAKW
jgi:GT2 family glycosyltransferase